jgi:hypothetical protein
MKDITIDQRLLGEYCLWCDQSTDLIPYHNNLKLCPEHFRAYEEMIVQMKHRSKIVKRARRTYFARKNKT